MQCSEEVGGAAAAAPSSLTGVLKGCVFQESVRSSSKSSSMKLKIIPKVKKEREKLHKQKSNSSLSGRSPAHRRGFWGKKPVLWSHWCL